MNETPGTKPTMEGHFKQGLFIIGMLLLFVATFQFYFSMQGIIQTWFEYQYVSIFKAAYNLLIMVLCLYFIRLYLVKR
jgi:hypothetical protein